MAAAALLLGATVAASSLWRGEALEHDDARSHVLVARRVLDNARPGLSQLGGVWLPLPHLLNAVPVLSDPLYRTGASAVAFSVAGYVLAVTSTLAFTRRLTGSRTAGVGAATVLALNPNVLYLTGTPMTEPLYLGLVAWGLASLARVIARPDDRPARCAAGAGLAGACLTRYDAWPVTIAALLLALSALRGPGDARARGWHAIAAVAAWPVLAVCGFLLHSHRSTGHWLATSGFFTADNVIALGRPVIAFDQVLQSACALTSTPLVVTAVLATLLVAGWGRPASRVRSCEALALAPWAALAFPWFGYVMGHPQHVRFGVPLAFAAAVGAGLVLPRVPGRVATVLVAGFAAISAGAVQDRAESPVAREARRGESSRASERAVTSCLASSVTPADRILASLGAVAPQVQALSVAGVHVRQVLHEGLGGEWLRALQAPPAGVRWILMSDAGRDVLARRAGERPSYLDGFREVCAGGRLRVFERVAPAEPGGPGRLQAAAPASR